MGLFSSNVKTNSDLSVSVVFGCSALYIPDTRDIAKEGQTKIVRVVQGRGMVRPLKMAVVLLSVHPLLDQYLFYLNLSD